MRIALLGSVALPVPPPLQGGTEWIAYYQAKGLAAKGHSVLLFGAQRTAKHFSEKNIQVIEVGQGDTVVGSTMSSFDPATMEASRLLRKEMVYLAEVVQHLIDKKDAYDVIVNNMRGEAIFLPLAKLLGKKFVNVMHLNMFAELAALFTAYDASLISISNAQRKAFPHLNYLATVYNAVDTSQFTFSPQHQDYLLMVGSIGRHKNQKDAITVAKKTGSKLILVGKIRDQDYFDELQKEIDGKQIQWIGEIPFAEKVTVYQGAKAFLFPINWEEPFGLVMIEAMSCGVPVIAYNHGAVKEVVVDGQTGYIVDNLDTMIAAVGKIDNISRIACHERVEEKFSISIMVEGYDKALSSLSL